MSASIDDILTAIKNNVVAIGTASANLKSLYNASPTASLFAGAATTSASVLYTGSPVTLTHINTINVCNTASTTATFSLYLVPVGGAASAANAVFFNVSIAPNSTMLWTGTLVLPVNGTIQASASATSVTIMIAGGSAA